MTTTDLVLGIVFSSIGAGYCLYGKRQSALTPFVCGAALIVLPYLITEALYLVLLGVLLAVAPFLLKQ